jgi:hypothetical protein
MLWELRVSYRLRDWLSLFHSVLASLGSSPAFSYSLGVINVLYSSLERTSVSTVPELLRMHPLYGRMPVIYSDEQNCSEMDLSAASEG